MHPRSTGVASGVPSGATAAGKKAILCESTMGHSALLNTCESTIARIKARTKPGSFACAIREAALRATGLVVRGHTGDQVISGVI